MCRIRRSGLSVVGAAAVAALGLVGSGGAASAAAPAYSADCASVTQFHIGTDLSYTVTNTCQVGVAMNAILNDGHSSGCALYDPQQSLSFNATGDYTAAVQDVVYCNTSGVA